MVDVRVGAEAWSSQGSGDNAEIGVLVLHGFTGSPASMRPLAEDLAEHGFAVELPLLPGHGTHWKQLRSVTWQDLARETVRAFETLRARTRTCVVLGLSNGGLIALRLAQTRGDDLAGQVLVNPFLFSLDPRVKVLPILKSVLPSIPGVINDIAKPDQDEVGYDRVPLKSLASVMHLQKEVRVNLPHTRVPTLLFTSRQDHVVDPKNSLEIAERIGASDFEHVWLERSYHVATLDHDYEVIRDDAIEFIERVTK